LEPINLKFLGHIDKVEGSIVKKAALGFCSKMGNVRMGLMLPPFIQEQ